MKIGKVALKNNTIKYSLPSTFFFDDSIFLFKQNFVGLQLPLKKLETIEWDKLISFCFQDNGTLMRLIHFKSISISTENIRKSFFSLVFTGL